MNICLIGFNLTNFLFAILLSKKGFEIDIIYEKKIKLKNSDRTIGISKKNLEFIKTILNISKKNFWPIKQIQIFNSKNNPTKKIEFKDDNNENFFLIKQSDLFKLSEKKCKQLKNISFKKYQSKEILKLEKKMTITL